MVSACQAGDIRFLDIRNEKGAYVSIDAHRGSLTALAVHRHAPVIASGSGKQLIKVFSLEGEQLGSIRYYPTFMAQKIGSVSCLTFHPYRVLLAAGFADACVSIYADGNSQARWISSISPLLVEELEAKRENEDEERSLHLKCNKRCFNISAGMLVLKFVSYAIYV